MDIKKVDAVTEILCIPCYRQHFIAAVQIPVTIIIGSHRILRCAGNVLHQPFAVLNNKRLSGIMLNYLNKTACIF